MAPHGAILATFCIQYTFIQLAVNVFFFTEGHSTARIWLLLFLPLHILYIAGFTLADAFWNWRTRDRIHSNSFTQCVKLFKGDRERDKQTLNGQRYIQYIKRLSVCVCVSNIKACEFAFNAEHKELVFREKIQTRSVKATSVAPLILDASPEPGPACFQEDSLFWLLLGNSLKIPSGLCQSFG